MKLEQVQVQEQTLLCKPLTKRELEVMQLIYEGLHSKEVAMRLYVSKRTVDFHLDHVYQKPGVNNRTKAVRALVSQGVLP